MPRLATEGKKVGEARREVGEEANKAQSDRVNQRREGEEGEEEAKVKGEEKA